MESGVEVFVCINPRCERRGEGQRVGWYIEQETGSIIWERDRECVECGQEMEEA